MVVDTLIQMHTHRATGSLLNSAPTTFGTATAATGVGRPTFMLRWLSAALRRQAMYILGRVLTTHRFQPNVQASRTCSFEHESDARKKSTRCEEAFL